MPVRKISVSLDEDVLQRATKVAEAEGVSLSMWLSRAAEQAADLAAKQQAMREYFETYGEPSAEDMQQAHDELKALGFFEPPSPEQEAARLAALARLYEPLPEEYEPTSEAEERRAG